VQSIKIKHFGPIKGISQEGASPLDIKKVTIFIGNQGSGKSTVAKLISIFTWIEKALVRGDYDIKWFERKNRLLNQFLPYHRLENYLFENTFIEYHGDAYHFIYKNGIIKIDEIKNNYLLPQIMYVPAERNFISYVKTPKELKLSSAALKEYLAEFDNAKNDMKNMVKLPINNVNLEYDKLNDVLNLKDDKYKIKLTDASSGFQSFVPLYLVSNFLANSVRKQSKEKKDQMSSEEMSRFKKGVEAIWNDTNLTDEQRRGALSVLSSKFNKSAFINIVEEPEQNLFPSSQREMVNCLLGFNNINQGNKLIITTHSPYIINFLSIAIQAGSLYAKIKLQTNRDKLLPKLYTIVPENALVTCDDVIIYQFDEVTGSIKNLNSQYGIPSDDNYLNNMLKEGNQLFDALLEIEEEL
jgi:predicted ATPase